MGKLLESVGKKIPTFCGIKFTSNDLAEGYQAMTANSSLAVFLGSDVVSDGEIFSRKLFNVRRCKIIIVTQLMSGGCTLGMDSFIMTSLNFIPEPALELLEFGKGNRDLENARKNQKFICKTVKEVTRYGTDRLPYI